MPSLIDIRRRIRSVKNTQQITKALKMVSAAKLRRAQERVMSARPYASSLRKMLANVVAASTGEAQDNPLLTIREEKRILLILVTSDIGKAGAFNANLIKAAQRFLEDHSRAEVSLELVGRKGRDFFRRRTIPIAGETAGIFQKAPRYEDALEIAKKVTDHYRNSDFDAVYLVYNEFKNVISQKLVTTRLLPVETPEGEEKIDYIFEQPPEEMLNSLLPRYIEVEMYGALIESAAAEHAARMTAMEAASKNSGDVISKLTLYMNRVRQAAITKEIIEVVSGAKALE
jgi:F-type H+-transporting ATPase subunit gamma